MKSTSFFSRREGSIGVMTAMFLGIMSLGTAGVIDYSMIVEAKRKAQDAIDMAAISSSRAVMAMQQDGGKNSASTMRQTIDSRGENAFNLNFQNARTSDIKLEFNYKNDRIEASAELNYEPLLVNAFGFMSFDFKVSSQITIDPAEDESGPVCISALDGSVTVNSGAVSAADCAVSASAALDAALDGNVKLTCDNGSCAHDDPFDGLAQNFIDTVLAKQGCQGKPGEGWTDTTYEGNTVFCDFVDVAQGQTMHLSGGTFYFKYGLTVKNGGRVDSTGNGGSTIIIGTGSTLHVLPGAVFTAKPPASGELAGISLAAVANLALQGSSIATEAPGYVVMNGVVHMPGHRLTVAGPDQIEIQDGDLAVWADDIVLSRNAMLPGSPTTQGPELPGISIQRKAAKSHVSR